MTALPDSKEFTLLNPILRHPQIYVYTEKRFTEADTGIAWVHPLTGKNCYGQLKIGYTEREDAEIRVKEQFKNRTDSYEIIFKESAITDQGEFFKDHEVHALLRKKGFNQLKNTEGNNVEWFLCTPEDVKSCLIELKKGIKCNTAHLSFGLRPEQEVAVETTKQYFESCAKDTSGKMSKHFLWNAKMRFGKTFTAYKLAERMGWSRILVLTYKPAVQSAWKSDLESHVDFQSWNFLSSQDTSSIPDLSQCLQNPNPFVYFASFQDLLGKTNKGTVKAKFKEILDTKWDCVFLDEYHYGAWRDSAKEMLSSDESEHEVGVDLNTQETEEILKEALTINHFLYLSGTPFRALAAGEFMEDQIFNWTYLDEQKSKKEWDSSKGPNPYESLPNMVLMTYQMPEALRAIALETEQNEFDLNTFFKAEKNEDTGEYQFKFEEQVQHWLDLIRGAYLPHSAGASTTLDKPPIPFEDKRLLPYLNHSLWYLPGVKECKAMEALMKKSHNKFYHGYTVINASGVEAGVGMAALPPVELAINKGRDTKSITLSCGKLMTGVTVPQWSSIFMLRNTTSPEAYFQAAFRVQSPWTLKDPSGTISIIKKQCYVFDFAPNRALSLINEYATKLNSTEALGSSSAAAKIDDFLNFLPVLCYDGYSMEELNTDALLDIVVSGTAANMLVRRWQSPKLVNLENSNLEKLLKDKTMVDALEKIEAFRNLSKDLAIVIKNEKDLQNLKKGNGVAQDKIKEKKLKDENAAKKKEIRDNLLKFITRVPVFMYLSDFREEKLYDVITALEPALFTKVTGLSVDEFKRLNELGIFNASNMNAAIFAFKRFEDASLSYAGNFTQSEVVGGFDTVIDREDLDKVSGGIEK